MDNGSEQLKKLLEHFKTLGKDVQKELSKALAAALLKEVKKGFTEGRDPYGTPWKRPQFRNGTALNDTGRLKDSFYATALGPESFLIGSKSPYASTHQYGATIKPVNKKFLAFQVPVVTVGKK